jgi:hypothetical protein
MEVTSSHVHEINELDIDELRDILVFSIVVAQLTELIAAPSVQLALICRSVSTRIKNCEETYVPVKAIVCEELAVTLMNLMSS